MLDASDNILSQQLRDLPYPDHGMALTLARSKLYHLNRFQFEHQKRATLNQTFHYAYARFAEKYADAASVQATQGMLADADDGFIAFCDEMAIAYKHCLVDAEKNSAQTRVIGLYLYLALFFHAQSMLQRFIHNIKQPGNAWREAHYLYANAEDHGMHRFSAGIKLHGALSTIHDQYVQLLLIAGANPYSLGHADTLWVVRFTQRAANNTGIVHPDNLDTVISALGVRLDSDEGPLRLRYKPSGSHPHARLLSTHALCDQLQAQRRQWFSDNPVISALSEQAMPASTQERVETLFAHLDECWRCQKHRGDNRESQSQTCELIWGLPAIYRWFYNGGNSQSRHFADQVSQRVQATLVEASATGFRFSVPVELKPYLHPGELLLLPQEHPEQTFAALGIVRWIKDIGNGVVALGAARVDAQIRAATVRLTGATPNERIALLLSKEVQSPHHKFLLCAQDTLCSPGEVELCFPHLNRSERARIGNVLMSTPYFKVLDTYLMSVLA